MKKLLNTVLLSILLLGTSAAVMPTTPVGQGTGNYFPSAPQKPIQISVPTTYGATAKRLF